MNLDATELLKGMIEKLGNESDLFSLEAGGAILPTIHNQASWKYAKSDSHYQFSDGNTIHHFHLPEGEKTDEAFPLLKKNDFNILDFGKDAHTQGTCQVHRSDPGNLYFTVQDGKDNPTYTFKHVNDDQWRAIPKLKKVSIDLEEFIKGAKEKIADVGDTLNNTLHSIGTAGREAISTSLMPGQNPLLAAGVGTGAGALYDLIKRKFYNSDEENAQESVATRAKRYLVPGAGLGLIGAAQKSMLGDGYYKYHPVFDPGVTYGQ